MARSIRSKPLETRAGRLRLAIRGKPYTVRIGRGLRLAYRRNKTDGTWSALRAQGTATTLRRIGFADDYSAANGEDCLDYWMAVRLARTMILGAAEAVDHGAMPLTVDGAIDQYARDLKAREGHATNGTWLRTRLPARLRAKVVALLDVKELRAWRDELVEEGELTKSSINRLMKCAKACFNLAASLEKRIANKAAWTDGLKALPEGETSRNVVISEAEVRAVVAAAYEDSPELGLFAEVGAVTAARPSQLARLACADALPDRLMMPSSRKGRGRRVVKRKPVPIPLALAARLQAIAKERAPDAPLLTIPSGGPWLPGYHYLLFQDAVRAAELDPAKVTFYAFRHTWITNALLRGVPVRVVADAADTSVAMIEKTYSAYISHHADALLRAGMLDLDAAPAGANVVKMANRKAKAKAS